MYLHILSCRCKYSISASICTRLLYAFLFHFTCYRVYRFQSIHLLLFLHIYILLLVLVSVLHIYSFLFHIADELCVASQQTFCWRNMFFLLTVKNHLCIFILCNPDLCSSPIYAAILLFSSF